MHFPMQNVELEPIGIPPNFRVDRGLVSKVVFLKFEHDPRNIIKSNTFQCQIDWKFFCKEMFLRNSDSFVHDEIGIRAWNSQNL